MLPAIAEMARRRGLTMLAALAVTIAASLFLPLSPAASAAEPTWWHPTNATPLPLHWNLGERIDPNNPVHIGERSLTGAVLPSPAVLDIDGDYNTRLGGGVHGSLGIVETLHARGQKAICYTDAGVQEGEDGGTTYQREAPYRFPVDRQADRSSWGGWWIDFTAAGTGTPEPDPRVLDVMRKRMIDWCVAGGFDAIEMDEVDYYENKARRSYPDVTRASELVYVRALYQIAHELGLAVIHKGSVDLIPDVADIADATLNEECGRYKECDSLDYFRGKAVWIAEYQSGAFTKVCNSYHAVQRGWNAARYKLGLPVDGGRQPCDGSWPAPTSQPT